ncbi:MAG: two-component system OmpR family response regulator [Cocleimonas sp.]|jgi:two-component system OmpR family response regulator
MQILIIEDDTQTAKFIQKGLQESGYVVDHAADGEAGLQQAMNADYDALVIDRMLPKLDGLSIIEQLRGQGFNVPILILSALGEVNQRVEGLKAGGDDYLVKPYSFSELLARIQSLIRRHQPQDKINTLQVRDLKIDLLSRQVTRENTVIELQPKEYILLESLMRSAGEVVTRTMLLEKVWDYNFDPQTNVIDVHISRIRAKIDKDFDVPLLKTVRGSGYILHDPDLSNEGPDTQAKTTSI